MKFKLIPILAVVLVSFATSVRAIERRASMIDWIGLDYGAWDDGDSIGFMLWGESALRASEGEWAVLAGVSFGEIAANDKEKDADYWRLNIGLKYYVFPLTSISVVGTYAGFNADHDSRGTAATATLKHRLVSAERRMSPYLFGAVTVQKDTEFSDSGDGDAFSEFIAQVGGGCDFAVNDELSFVFEGSTLEGENTSGAPVRPDGILISVAMKYYWK